MPRTTLEPRYFERMAQATEEKTALIDHLVTGTVADIGAGGGQLTARMAQSPGTEKVYAIDDSVDATRRLREITTIETLYGGTERLKSIAPIDNVVFSSVLHEIYSYAETDRGQAWEKAITDAIFALRPGGRLIIRDFVLPDHPDAPAYLIAPGEEHAALVREYMSRTPFTNLASLIETRDGAFAGSRRTVTEALLTVGWGQDSLERESHERYCLDTLAGYADVVTNLTTGLELVEARSETQPGYVDALSAWTVRDENKSDWFPDTKALWVFEKKEI